MNFFTAPLIVVIVFYFVYKMIELLTHRKERILMVERFSEISTLQTADLSNLFSTSKSNGKFIALRFGAAFLGVGAGLLFALLIGICTGYVNVPYEDSMYRQARNIMEIMYGASTFLFCGLALLGCFIAEHKISKNQ